MIGIIDYGAGNIRSVYNALDRIGVESCVSGDPAELARATKLILPGVGSAGSAMESLRGAGLAEWLANVRVPVLGICLGMQILFESSSECDAQCLGVIPGNVRRFEADRVKIPHIGWNLVRPLRDDPLLHGIEEPTFFYFVHSYHLTMGSESIAGTEYGCEFASAVNYDNYWGVQFHPEKSGASGLRLLHNFICLC